MKIICAVTIAYPADKKRAHLDMHNVAEIFSVKHGKLAAVLLVDIVIFQRDWAYGMKNSRNKMILPFSAVVDIAVAVIIVYA